MVPNEAAMRLPLRLWRSPGLMPEPSRATRAVVASEPRRAALPV
jgi:hypothetical protein